MWDEGGKFLGNFFFINSVRLSMSESNFCFSQINKLIEYYQQLAHREKQDRDRKKLARRRQCMPLAFSVLCFFWSHFSPLRNMHRIYEQLYLNIWLSAVLIDTMSICRMMNMKIQLVKYWMFRCDFKVVIDTKFWIYWYIFRFRQSAVDKIFVPVQLVCTLFTP